MSENPLADASGGPVTLLEQLIGMVARQNGRMDELSQDMAAMKQHMAGMEQRMTEMKQEIRADLRSELGGFMKALGKELAGFKDSVTGELERQRYENRNEQETRFLAIEARIAALEEAERRRKEGKGA